MPDLWLLRYGETPWTVLGRHTGRTGLEFISRGRQCERRVIRRWNEVCHLEATS